MALDVPPPQRAAHLSGAGAAPGAVLDAVLRAADAQLVIVVDEDHRITGVSEGITALMGHLPETVIGWPYERLFHEDGLQTHPGLRVQWAQPVDLPGHGLTKGAVRRPLTGRAALAHTDGLRRPVRLASASILDAEGRSHGFVVVATEAGLGGVLARRRAAAASFQMVFDQSPTPMAMVGLDGQVAGRIHHANAALADLTGRTCDDLVGISAMTLFQLTPLEAGTGYFTRTTWAFSPGTGCTGDTAGHVVVRPDGSVRDCHVTTVPLGAQGAAPACEVFDGGGDGIDEPWALMTVHDVTTWRAREHALTLAALHDPLTGLCNRSLFQDRLELALVADRRARSGVSVLYLDLDGFKTVNDRWGHAAGDALLCDVGDRLRRVMRAEDTVARLGGDEFAVVCPGLDLQHLPAVLARLHRSLAAPSRLPGGEMVEITASVGAATSSHQNASLAQGALEKPTWQQLVQAADQAMYATKKQHKNRTSVQHESTSTVRGQR